MKWTQVDPIEGGDGELQDERWAYIGPTGMIHGYIFRCGDVWYADVINDGCDVGCRQDAVDLVEEYVAEMQGLLNEDPEFWGGRM